MPLVSETGPCVKNWAAEQGEWPEYGTTDIPDFRQYLGPTQAAKTCSGLHSHKLRFS
jgi:hypothetical protein